MPKYPRYDEGYTTRKKTVATERAAAAAAEAEKAYKLAHDRAIKARTAPVKYPFIPGLQPENKQGGYRKTRSTRRLKTDSTRRRKRSKQ